jgi:hypothetical protein
MSKRSARTRPPVPASEEARLKEQRAVAYQIAKAIVGVLDELRGDVARQIARWLREDVGGPKSKELASRVEAGEWRKP